jgi:hypothetical protein
VTDATTGQLIVLGDPAAAACEGDFCVIPDHHEQAVVNRRLDDDAVCRVQPASATVMSATVTP